MSIKGKLSMQVKDDLRFCQLLLKAIGIDILAITAKVK